MTKARVFAIMSVLKPIRKEFLVEERQTPVQEQAPSVEEVLAQAEKILARYREDFEELAK